MYNSSCSCIGGEILAKAVSVMMRMILAGLAVGTVVLAADLSSPVTFSKDVLPILQKNCQSCHRPGQAAPMSLLSYQEARPWAKAIKAAVTTRKMPPWFADPNYGHFVNDRSLKQSEIDTLVKWADTGAAPGDPKDAPAPVAMARRRLGHPAGYRHGSAAPRRAGQGSSGMGADRAAGAF